MAQYFHIHPHNPQPRLIRRAAEIICRDGVIAYPTDSSYALGCHIGNKEAVARIRTIRQLDHKHNFTLVCRDLSEIAVYAKVNNVAYRLLKANTPGPYTFILPATREVPRRLQHPKRKTIGLRIPDNIISQALLAELGEPLMSVTLILPGEQLPLSDPVEIRAHLEHRLDLIIDGGYCGLEPTTVIDLESDQPHITRAGKGASSAFAALD
ncbi:MAG TPA: L-threonylcarbamoyladenylate synthase [Acidiferrobacterales bacterium]|nr:L-threonylcarbamoyladenylate synthase [Acidiferrobacterales bacterium]